jgi:transposase-like protein
MVMPSILDAPHFHNEAAAYAKLEGIVWPNGPVCPHCKGTERIGKLKGGATRLGVHKCYACRKQFRVTVGTVFESSHIPLNLWLQAAYLLCSSKKGISSNQLHRTLGVTLKTAWFMTHRLREAMKGGGMLPPLGGEAPVEVDETYMGNKKGAVRTPKGRIGHASKRAVVTLVERGGTARSFHVERADKATVTAIVRGNVLREATLMTDESRLYTDARGLVARHDAVSQSMGEWVRGDVHTNTVEGFFSVFKRGMRGVYQHCGERHLHRYLAEFDFRYNNRAARGVDDTARTTAALRGITGKRLTYRDSSPAA